MQLKARTLWHRVRDRLAVWLPALLALLPGTRAVSASLPDERADTLYHLYDGGGQKVQGPALLVRKNFAERVSVSGGYYVDRISGASIDVVTNASPYHETRKEAQVGAELLHRDTLLSVGFTHSKENDFKSDTFQIGVSQDLFESRTTLALNYSRGNDKVGRVDSPFEKNANRDNYNVTVTQVINPTLLGTLGFEVSADDGYLQNPYRSARVQGGTVPEIYPKTRTGEAVSLKFVKSWTPDWSSRIESRLYHDTWKVDAFNIGVGASHTIRRDWILDATYRFYVQGHASFYANNFDEVLNYMARDKELASFTGHTLGAKLSIPIAKWKEGVVDGVDFSVSTYWLDFHYSDFTDVRDGDKYGFSAFVGQAFFTIRY